MKRILFSSIVAVGIIALTLNSCKKEKPDTETQSAVDNNICETEFTKVMPAVNSFGIKENGVRSVQTACPTITVDSTSIVIPGTKWPRIMLIDYGGGCLADSIDGKIRKGQIKCEFSNKWSVVGSRIKVTLINYYVNNIGYACDSIIISHDAANTYTNTIYGGKCVSSTWSLEWAATRTLSQTAGTNTPNFPYDDVFQLTGTANGKNRNGLAYTIATVAPVIKRSSCSWIESGKLNLTPAGLPVRTIDFGSGACDNQATITINGNTFTFTMN